eukprot:COSAG03_NODE_18081_length_362_cov_0.916350_1_plen_40_part_01
MRSGMMRGAVLLVALTLDRASMGTAGEPSGLSIVEGTDKE